jgi:hypothetical protein
MYVVRDNQGWGVSAYFRIIALKPISIYTDKYSYSAGDTMRLGLNITNPCLCEVTVCVAIWIEKPDHTIRLVTHAHAVTLPPGFRYSNPSFQFFMLRIIPSGIYTWHAALLNPFTHEIIVEDTSEWEFS